MPRTSDGKTVDLDKGSADAYDDTEKVMKVSS